MLNIYQIIAEVCVEITSVQPNLVCIDSTFEIVLTGSGFNNTRDPSAVRCRFRTDSGQTFGESHEREGRREERGRERERAGGREEREGGRGGGGRRRER